ncbi:helix-turn-helix domain-containing protein [Fictibacillus phosphorivorans]|uniref:helix-turn-helix domain-containing protein n=1 Tax=Fictibacillus phosphorivorans TaxID=1221500 RepID=UPI00203DEF55|nr:AraC family transcriptional regulator [Fictibacillus phosphorivorans]MCM3719543.1 AraC family transcriptional regulator [Fictibacillus phosphorivorans]MCM3777234.1 AraC family transcriptional regulator [Fictibacillus phosphorivorans]
MTKKESTNFVLHAKSEQFYWEGIGQRSLKTFFNGKAQYKTSKGFFAVEESRYLLLNEGEYTISIDEPKVVESFCLFFKDSFAEEVFHSLKEKNDRLLSDPFKDTSPIGFFEKTYHKNKILSSQLESFMQIVPSLEIGSVGYEEQFHKIMCSILNEHFDTYKEIESIHAIRSSTREELYRRVSIAHDYIRSNFDQPIKLDEVARVACLSPNHLLRNYNQIYGRTPHQHISEFRVQKAKQLLSKTNNNVTDITFILGFQNPVSFSKMFKQHVGISPKEYRKKVIMDKKY